METLTDDSWAGLPLKRCNVSEGSTSGVIIGAPLLVLWESGGPEICVGASTLKRTSFRPRAGNFDFYFPGCEVTGRYGSELGQTLLVEIPPDWILHSEALPPYARLASLRPRLQFPHRRLRRLVRALHAHHEQGQPLGSFYTEALSSEVVQAAFHTGDSRQHVELSTSVRECIRTLIMERLAEPPPLNCLASLAGLGIAQFLRAFRAAFGTSPHQFIVQQRIERGKCLLNKGLQPVATLALDLGFASHAHFSSTFKQVTGVNPSDFRRARGRLAV